MENPMREEEREDATMFDLNGATSNPSLVNSFMEITSSSKEAALFFLESHKWDLDAAVSTFLDDDNYNNHPNPPAPASQPSLRHPPSTPSESHSSDYSRSRSRSRSLSPAEPDSRAPYGFRSRGKKPDNAAGGRTTRGGVRTLADLNQVLTDESNGDDDDNDVDYDDEDDEAQQYYAGGENSGILVQAPKKLYDGDTIFDQARCRAVERPADLSQPSSGTSFSGRGRLLTGEMASSAYPPPEMVNHVVTLWRNGFTVNDGPLRRFDDPANSPFLESIRKSECPIELQPADGRTQVHLDLQRREENYSVRKCKTPFPGLGRTLASSSESDALVQAVSPSDVPAASPSLAQGPAMGLAVDSSLPTTSIQLRLADGTRMVLRFNLCHTIRDIRAVIEASRVGTRNYQLQAMGFPPKQLTDQDQTIEEAGIASSVVIQKF